MNSFHAKSRSVFAFAILAITWQFGTAEARPVRIWTYKDLFSESKVVCLASPKSTKKIENKDFFPDHLDCFESKLAVKATLKGDPKIVEIRFIHYHYKPGANGIGNGPTFAVLRDWTKAEGKVTDPRKPEPEVDPEMTFLFFLRDRDGGAYGPISGDADAHISVAIVQGSADEE